MPWFKSNSLENIKHTALSWWNMLRDISAEAHM